MSTEKAAQNLGMNVLVLNINQDSWQLEFDHGTVMEDSLRTRKRSRGSDLAIL